MFTQAMNRVVQIATEMGLVHRSPEESRQFLLQNQAVIQEGIQDALDRAAEDTVTALTMIDTAKMLAGRDRLFRQRTGGDSAQTVILAMTRPDMPEKFLRSSPDTAICEFYMSPAGTVWVLIAQELRDRPTGFAGMEIVPKEAASEFQAQLAAYAARRPGQLPDFALQAELLQTFGRALIPFFLRYTMPRRIVLIPHRNLHLLPLHAMFVRAEGTEFYLDGFVREIVYGSCLTELLYGNISIRQDSDSTPKASRFLAALDTSAQDLEWIGAEKQAFEAVKLQGVPVDIITKLAELPPDLRPYVAINWSGHAMTDPTSWQDSFLQFGDEQVRGSHIADTWRLDGNPLVTLSMCDSAVNASEIELLDEYCGLDRAFMVAGARTVFGSLWPVADEIAALASITLPIWAVISGVPASHALVIFQSNLRNGVWHQWLLRDDQIAQVAQKNAQAAQLLHEAHSKFRRIDAAAFNEPFFWSPFRCYGMPAQS